MKFRWHRGGLAESMETVVEIEPTRQALADLVTKDWIFWGETASPAEVDVRPYSYDDRIEWDTYLVFWRGRSVGMSDGPVES